MNMRDFVRGRRVHAVVRRAAAATLVGGADEGVVTGARQDSAHSPGSGLAGNVASSTESEGEVLW
jgi:hypothetical protein